MKAENRFGTYVKQEPHQLKGKRAMLQCYPDTGRCLAQFDDIETGYGFGWHDFLMADFEIDDEVMW